MVTHQKAPTEGPLPCPGRIPVFGGRFQLGRSSSASALASLATSP